MLCKMKHYVPGYSIFFILYSSLALHKIWYFKIKLQKWAIRTISLEHYRSHTGPLFNKHNILNVFDTFKLELGVFMYKHQANLLPQAFSNYFVKHNQIHKYPTKKCRRLYYSQSQKDVFRSIHIWTNIYGIH